MGERNKPRGRVINPTGRAILLSPQSPLEVAGVRREESPMAAPYPLPPPNNVAEQCPLQVLEGYPHSSKALSEATQAARPENSPAPQGLVDAVSK